MKPLKEFVVRDMLTGKFIHDFSDPVVLSDRPRRFKRLSDLSSCLSYLKDVKYTWEVVEFQLVETDKFPVAALLKTEDKKKLKL